MITTNLTETKLNFEIGAKIGNGGEGEVYHAFDPQLNANIAVKKVPIAKFTHQDLYFEESRKLYLTNHHNIVKVIYACKDDDFIYLSMPFYKNGSLKGLIDNRFLTTREIIRYSLQFLSGLNNIHSKGLIHFDIKPENILINNSNQALISDFGLAEYTGHYGFASNSGTTQVLAPPEYFNQPVHNLKFDIYQAGLTMYRICNGENIFLSQLDNAFISRGNRNDANFIQKLQAGNFPNRQFFLPHIPRQLRKIVSTALKPNPDDRYSSVIAILNDLSKINSANDWTYSTDNSGNETWKKHNYIVTCLKTNNIFTVSALKNGRQNRSFCKTVQNEVEKNTLLYDCLNTNW